MRVRVFQQAVEKKTNGVRAALRVENKVAVRAIGRNDSFDGGGVGGVTLFVQGLARPGRDRGVGRGTDGREATRREGWIVTREMRTRCARGVWVDDEDAQRLTEDDVDVFARVDSLHAQGSQKGTLLPYHRH